MITNQNGHKNFETVSSLHKIYFPCSFSEMMLPLQSCASNLKLSKQLYQKLLLLWRVQLSGLNSSFKIGEVDGNKFFFIEMDMNIFEMHYIDAMWDW